MIKTQLSTQQREGYEQYLRAMIDAPDSEAKLVNALDKFVQGSDDYDFLYLVTKQKLGGGSLNPADKKLFSEYIDQRRQGYEELKIRQQFLDYDLSANDKERKDFLGYLSDALSQGVSLSHAKPFQMEHRGEKPGEESKEQAEEIRQKATLSQSIFEKDQLAEVIAASKMYTKKEEEHSRRNHQTSKLSSMPLWMVHEIDFNLFMPQVVYDYAEQLASNNQIAGISNPSLISSLKSALKEIWANDKYAEMSLNMCQKMTLEQLKEFKALTNSGTDANVIGAFFSKQYCEELNRENQEIWTNEEKIANLTFLHNQAKAQGLPTSLIQQLLYYLIVIGPKANVYNKDLFKSYVAFQESRNQSGSMMKALGNMLTKAIAESHPDKDWSDFIGTVMPEGGSNGHQHEINALYLEHFAFLNNGKLDEFKKKDAQFLQQYFIEEIEDKVQIYLAEQGMSGLTANKRIDVHKFKRWADEVCLTFLPENKDKFKIQEEVELHLAVKNVSTVYCKVFEFNTLTYYRKNLKPFDSSIDLDGLESTITRKFEFNKPNNCKRKEKFAFPELQGRQGLFIVDFVGNGRSARAVIKKGSLSLIHRMTEAGHLCFVLDDDRKICKGENVGLWIENKFQAAKQDGTIFIPYGSHPQTMKIIIQAGDFAQLWDFTRQTEKFLLSCNFFLNEESVLLGSNAQIVISPQLTINGRNASLSLLRQCNVEIRTVNFIDNTPTSQKFENQKFKDDQDLTVSFNVPANLKFINVTLTAQVNNTTTKSVDKFELSKQFDIKCYSDSNTIHEWHLRMVKTLFKTCPVNHELKRYDGQIAGRPVGDLKCDVCSTVFKPTQGYFNCGKCDYDVCTKCNSAQNNYELNYLGKNGEPMPFVPVTLQFTHAFLGNINNQLLETDSKGKLYLGPLNDVLSFSVQGQDDGSNKKYWQLPNLKSDTWHCPQEIHLLEGSTLEIPVAEMWNSAKPNELMRQQFTLFRSIKGIVIEDWFKKIKAVAKNPGSHYFLLQVAQLEQGEYTLKIRGQKDINISITVHKGIFWNNDPFFILKRSCIQELIQTQKIVKIQTSSLFNNKLCLQLADFSAKARVHLFATHFIAPESITFLKGLQQIKTLNMDQSSIFGFAKWANMLLSDRKLGDEYRYVFDRANAERTLGNSLDRPSLLDKRLFTRKTEMDAEVLNSGSNFNQIQESYAPMMQCVGTDNIRNMQMHAPQMQSIGGMESLSYGRQQRYGGPLGLQIQPEQAKANYMTDFQNFLRDSPLQIFNLKPDQNGVVTFQSEKLGLYSTLQIVVVDRETVVQHTKNLQRDEDPRMTDQSLQKALDENKGLTQSRLTKNLLKDATDFIQDYASSQVMLVDDLQKVKKILYEINKMTNQPQGGKWDKLEFVHRWRQMNKETKDFHYSEYSCHELNFFLKRHDSAYFESIVRPFLINKLGKSFMDLFLLDMDQDLLNWRRPHKLTELNALEKCLLIQVLNRNGQQQLARSLANNMREKVSAFEEALNNKAQQNSIFDLVLNLNNMNKQQVEKSASASREMPSAPRMMAMSMAAPSQAFGSAGPPGMRLMAQQNLFCANFDHSMQDDDCGDDFDFAQQRNINMSKEKFEQLEATSEYMETYYFDTNTSPEHLIAENTFWSDYADHLICQSSQFVSANFTCCTQPRQSFFALCVLDLPEVTDASLHGFQADESRGRTVTAGSNLIMFKQEIKEVALELKKDFIVTHRYHRNDKYGIDHKTDDDDAIPSEFLVNVPYECEVIMTNVSSIQKEFKLFYQIPIGSMPMKMTRSMESKAHSLAPYTTKRVLFSFYFPSVGKKGHFPSNVSIDESVTARGEFNILNVVSRRNIQQSEDIPFDDLLHIASEEVILNYLRTKNLYSNAKGFSLRKILFMMGNESFWSKCVAILRDRQIYDAEIWSYSLKHRSDIKTLKEYILTSKPSRSLSQITGFFESNLLSVGPSWTKNGFQKFLEYNPMINSRAHKIGQDGEFRILNKTFRQTFDRFLQTMAFKTKLSFEDKLVYVYYLQLQDRINEAIKIFETLQLPEAESEEDMAVLEMQFDYLSAYFDFFTGAEDKYKVARRVVQRYDNYPVSHWRLMFLQIQDQLNDFDGEFDQMDYDSESASGADTSIRLAEKRQENMKNSKSKEPLLASIEIDETGCLVIETVNIKTVFVKYYMIDAEVLFSRAPFLKNNAEEFSYVKPFLQEKLQMRDENATLEEMVTFVSKKLPLPQSLLNQNLVIEINGEGKQEFRTFYSCALKVQVLESFGELKVTHNEKALGEVYVKVFMQDSDGAEKFYRDGYTDIRGKFEYANTSLDQLKKVRKFSILVQSKSLGSQIKEVDPPKIDAMPAPSLNDAAMPMQQQMAFCSNSMDYQKQSRMIERNNWVQSKKK